MTAQINDSARSLLSAHRVIASSLVDSFRERGYSDIKPRHTALFLGIDRRSGTRLTELAVSAGITKQGMMIIVDELEQMGYVRRVADSGDSRAKVVKLTASGRRCAAECRRAVAAVEAEIRHQLGERRYEALGEALQLLCDTDELMEA